MSSSVVFGEELSDIIGARERVLAPEVEHRLGEALVEQDERERP